MYKPRRKRIYLAAAFRRQSELRKVREHLTEFGFDVLASWLDEDSKTEGRLSQAEANRAVDLCVFEMIRASIFVCFIDPKDSNRGGHQVELGYAWAKGKVLISVGSAERNIFHKMYKVRQYATVEEFLQNVQSWKNYLPPLV